MYLFQILISGSCTTPTSCCDCVTLKATTDKKCVKSHKKKCKNFGFKKGQCKNTDCSASGGGTGPSTTGGTYQISCDSNRIDIKI